MRKLIFFKNFFLYFEKKTMIHFSEPIEPILNLNSKKSLYTTDV